VRAADTFPPGMDLNPYRFSTPFRAFEFGNHCLQSHASLIVVPMAWLTNQSPASLLAQAEAPDTNTLEYWLSRLGPLVESKSRSEGRSVGSPESDVSSAADQEEGEQERIFVAANRSGSEGDAHYAGTSAICGIRRGEVNVYGVLGRGEEDLLVCDVPTPLSALFGPEKQYRG
jgi:protein N-terminal amidase